MKTSNFDAALALIRKHPGTAPGNKLARMVAADRAHFLLGYVNSRRGFTFLRVFKWRRHG